MLFRSFVSLGLATRLAEAGHPLGLSCFAPFRLVMKAREKGFLASLAHGRDGLVSLLRRRCGTGGRWTIWIILYRSYFQDVLICMLSGKARDICYQPFFVFAKPSALRRDEGIRVWLFCGSRSLHTDQSPYSPQSKSWGTKSGLTFLACVTSVALIAQYNTFFVRQSIAQLT